MINVAQKSYQSRNLFTYADADIWIGDTHNNLIAAGCLQTSDTGQYLIGASTGSLTANQNLGYRIYELNDSYSAECPIFFKLTFTVLAAYATSAVFFGRLTLAVGYELNGSGAFSGPVIAKNLKSFGTSNSTAHSYNANSKYLSVKGEDFLFHGNQVCAGFQATSLVLESGHFAILRQKINGVVDPYTITVIYPLPAASLHLATSWRYTRLNKLSGISSENLNPMRLPRVRNQDGVLVAAPADISESGIVETADRIICFRASAADTPWVTYRMSIDGITEKKYLHVPMSLFSSSNTPTFETLGLCAQTDGAEPGVGAIGILIDE